MGGQLWRLGRRFCSGERRRELDDRHDLDVPGLEVRRGGVGKVCCAVVRVALGVHLCDFCVAMGAGEARGGDLDVGDICA